jgi:hypothetical protein
MYPFGHRSLIPSTLGALDASLDVVDRPSTPSTLGALDASLNVVDRPSTPSTMRTLDSPGPSTLPALDAPLDVVIRSLPPSTIWTLDRSLDVIERSTIWTDCSRDVVINIYRRPLLNRNGLDDRCPFVKSVRVTMIGDNGSSLLDVRVYAKADTLVWVLGLALIDTI